MAETKETDWEGFFKAWDKDGSGSLEVKELVSMMTDEPLKLPKDVAEKTAKRIMETVDKDGDGTISLEEFLTVVKSAC